MTEQINQIVPLSGGHFYLQSVYNDTDTNGNPVAGASYYVGYSCQGVEDSAPLEGEQPGQVYLTDGIASVESAPADIQL